MTPSSLQIMGFFEMYKSWGGVDSTPHSNFPKNSPKDLKFDMLMYHHMIYQNQLKKNILPRFSRFLPRFCPDFPDFFKEFITFKIIRLEKWITTYFKALLELFTYMNLLHYHNAYSGHNNRGKLGQNRKSGQNTKIGENRGKFGKIGILFIYIKIHTSLCELTKYYEKLCSFG